MGKRDYNNYYEDQFISDTKKENGCVILFVTALVVIALGSITTILILLI